MTVAALALVGIIYSYNNIKGSYEFAVVSAGNVVGSVEVEVVSQNWEIAWKYPWLRTFPIAKGRLNASGDILVVLRKYWPECTINSIGRKTPWYEGNGWLQMNDDSGRCDNNFRFDMNLFDPSRSGFITHCDMGGDGKPLFDLRLVR